MKRLYICFYKDAEWIMGIVAHSHKQAKKIFYKGSRSMYDGCDYWIDIRLRLSKKEVDVSKLPIGEIESDWGFKYEIYSEL